VKSGMLLWRVNYDSYRYREEEVGWGSVLNIGEEGSEVWLVAMEGHDISLTLTSSNS
jgi:hypothetical protein